MLFLYLFATLLICNLAVHADPSAASTWPMAKGTYWIYEGDVETLGKDPVSGENRVDHRHIQWRSEVVDDVPDAGVAVLHGFPTDPVWPEHADQVKDRLIFHVGTDYYETTKDVLPIFARLKQHRYQSTTPPTGDTNHAQLLLSTPLAVGKRFNNSDIIISFFTDRYCSVVESAFPFAAQKIKGAPRLPGAECYAITFRTSPDNDELDFVPGLGVVGYSYCHHGTTMNVDLHLVEFGHDANPPAPVLPQDPKSP